jgi:hypothetical protein
MKSCKEISKLLSEDQELPFLQKVELKMHLLICKNCSTYAIQLKMLKEGFHKLYLKLTEVENSKVKELEKNVLDKLKNK